MEKNRSKQALKNMIFGLIYEALLAVSGILIPRFILLYYGSPVNGIVGSITQFLSIIVLLKGGVGGVTRAALYKPLSQGDSDSVSRILKATHNFLKKIALIFAIGVIVFACVYFFIIRSQFTWVYSFTLVLILAMGTFAQYFFGMTSQLLLQADQKNYIWNIIQAVGTILNIAVCLILIYVRSPIHIVKIGTSIIYSLCPIFLGLYVHKKYNISKNVLPDNDSIKQRWNAFSYQIATYIHENTDVVVLTLFTPLLEVSVYNIYSLVVNSCIRRVVETSFIGFDSALGDIKARDLQKSLTDVMTIYEFLSFVISGILFSTTLFLLPSFISIYTSGVDDVSYDRQIFSIIFVVAELLFCFRMPYYSLVTSCGLYKETRIGAYIEASLNIAISLSLVPFLGIIGVAIGTLVAMFFRWIYLWVYCHKHIIRRSTIRIVKYIITVASSFAVGFLFTYFVPSWDKGNLFAWSSYALTTLLIVGFSALIVSFITSKNEIKMVSKRLFKALSKKTRNNQK